MSEWRRDEASRMEFSEMSSTDLPSHHLFRARIVVGEQIVPANSMITVVYQSHCPFRAEFAEAIPDVDYSAFDLSHLSVGNRMQWKDDSQRSAVEVLKVLRRPEDALEWRSNWGTRETAEHIPCNTRPTAVCILFTVYNRTDKDQYFAIRLVGKALL